MQAQPIDLVDRPRVSGALIGRPRHHRPLRRRTEITG